MILVPVSHPQIRFWMPMFQLSSLDLHPKLEKARPKNPKQELKRTAKPKTFSTGSQVLDSGTSIEPPLPPNSAMSWA